MYNYILFNFLKNISLFKTVSFLETITKFAKVGVDAVGNDRYCFNIKGNDFRLIVLIIFRTRTVFVLWFGSHAEYDKLNKSIGAANVTHDK